MDTLDSTSSVDNRAFETKDYLDAQYKGIAFPSLVSRVKALFIDLIIILIVFTATTLLIDSIGDIPNFAKGFILIFMFYLYDPILISFTGGTLGHKVMKLKVRRYGEPDKKISLGNAFLRFFTKGILGWVSFLTVTANKRKRAIHDWVSRSIVMTDIYKPSPFFIFKT